jgi:hypothetical protein
MDYNTEKVDEVVLAPLYLTLHERARVWKPFEWEAMTRLHQKGCISDPRGKAKSMVGGAIQVMLANKRSSATD